MKGSTMFHDALRSRRDFLRQAGTIGAGLTLAGALPLAAEEPSPLDSPIDPQSLFTKIIDPEIRQGFEAAVSKNILTTMVETEYPGFFWISGDGKSFAGATWPGLDSWQMTGCYMLLGYKRIVLDYFDFVQAAQRKDGHIPFSIFPGEDDYDQTFGRTLRKEDVYTFTPKKRFGQLAVSRMETRKWIGMFKHWRIESDPLGVLGPVSYLLTAGEIFDFVGDESWLKEKLASLEAAAKYMLTKKNPQGLIAGSGYYIEKPARWGCDGVTQCYVIRANRELARLLRAAGDREKEIYWNAQADALAKTFRDIFWRDDHFAEYVHVERGLIDTHGLSDSNWAAVAFDVATDEQIKKLWPLLMSDPGFWQGDMPTQIVTKPTTYEEWEYGEKMPFPIGPELYDAAAMGRVWYLEAMACRKMKTRERLVESVRKVARAGIKDGGYWYERYRVQPDGTVSREGPKAYAEYAAILTRVVLTNRELFFH
jgi:hypothetical protein